MKIIFTRPALADLEDIRVYALRHYPHLRRDISFTIHASLARLARYPHSAREVAQRPGVHVVVVRKHPYKIFYAIGNTYIEILHIHHTARSDA